MIVFDGEFYYIVDGKVVFIGEDVKIFFVIMIIFYEDIFYCVEKEMNCE